MDDADREEHRRWWRSEWLTRVQEMADLGAQRETWLNPSPPVWNPHYSYVEYTTTYLDFANWPERLTVENLSDEEAGAVALLDEKVRTYTAPTDDFDHGAILNDPQWLEIVDAARQAQESLANIIKDPGEREALLERCDHSLEAARRTA